jgi:hypothetical protein
MGMVEEPWNIGKENKTKVGVQTLDYPSACEFYKSYS